ncbi:TolC family protein [Flavobacterium sp.]|uniref:TolC family protein n=1 Tax=Flavobacterium sp. TaxID=239 RepID=UPI0038FC0954
MNYKIFFQALILVTISSTIYAQDVLKIEDAVGIALKNNYDIRIASNEVKVDSIGVNIANAGMLPKLDATLTQNNNIQYSKQTRSTGEIQELNNAKNNNLNYGVTLGWTVFDGFKMFARYDQLKELQKQGETTLKMTILTKVGDVMTAYYDLVQQQQLLKALDTTIVISKQRLKTAENRFTIGKASKLEVLNAQVDMNTDTTNFLRQKEMYENTKIQLNQILARDVSTNFTVIETVDVDDKLVLSDLNSLATKQNPQLQLALIDKRVAELDLKQVRANRYPTIKISTGYMFNETESSLGFTSQSSSRGFNYGVSASLNIFNGFQQTRNEKIAKLQIENSSIVIEKQSQILSAQLATAFQTYLTNIELSKLEENNEAIAKKNLEITLDKFKIGTISTLEFRSAQQNYVNAIARNSSAKFQAKISEVALKEITGNIKF